MAGYDWLNLYFNPYSSSLLIQRCTSDSIQLGGNLVIPFAYVKSRRICSLSSASWHKTKLTGEAAFVTASSGCSLVTRWNIVPVWHAEASTRFSVRGCPLQPKTMCRLPPRRNSFFWYCPHPYTREECRRHKFFGKRTNPSLRMACLCHAGGR